MTPSFDLVDQAWLPVAVDPGTTMVGLAELFRRAHEFDDLAVPVPPAAAGLWRILYAITARVTGLDDATGWGDRQEKVLLQGGFDPTAVEGYLDRYRGRFDLFGAGRPWLQDPRLVSQCSRTSGVNKLVFDRPSGQNQVWFGHHRDAAPVPIPSAQAAWYMAAQLYYGASGRCSSREVGGQRYANTNAGPLRSAMSYHPVGRNLFESLVLGVPARHAVNDDIDLCPWEREELPDPLGRPYSATWPCGILTGRFQHAVLLVPAADGRMVIDAYLTWAWRQPPAAARDSYLVQRLSKQGDWYALKADGDRALWRDVDALLADDLTGSRRPEIISTAADLDAGAQRVRAYGFDQDGQTRDRQWFTAVTPPILRWLRDHDEEAVSGVVALHRAAERVAGRLGYALRAAWQEIAPGRDRDGPWVTSARAHFWPEAERVFWQRVDQRAFDHPRRAFLHLGHQAIDHAAADGARRPRVARAIASAHRRLAGDDGDTSDRQEGS